VTIVHPNIYKSSGREERIWQMARLFISIYVLGESGEDKPPLDSKAIGRALYDACQEEEIFPDWFRQECRFIGGRKDIPYDYLNHLRVYDEIYQEIVMYLSPTSVPDAVDYVTELGYDVEQAEEIGTRFFAHLNSVLEAERLFWPSINAKRK